MKQKLLEIVSKGFDIEEDESKTVYSSSHINGLLNEGWRIVSMIREAEYNTIVLLEHD